MKALILFLPLLLAGGCSPETEVEASSAPEPSAPAAPKETRMPVEPVAPAEPIAPPVEPAPIDPVAQPAPPAEPPAIDPVVPPPPAPIDPVTPPAPAPPVPSEGDLALMDSVRVAIESLTTLSNIQVLATGGGVTLTGTVATETEKEAAGAAARTVPGVITIDNQLVVKGL